MCNVLSIFVLSLIIFYIVHFFYYHNFTIATFPTCPYYNFPHYYPFFIILCDLYSNLIRTLSLFPIYHVDGNKVKKRQNMDKEGRKTHPRTNDTDITLGIPQVLVLYLLQMETLLFRCMVVIAGLSQKTHFHKNHQPRRF